MFLNIKHIVSNDNSMKPIFLTGMMGSGKTFTGRVLADLLSCQLVDLDEEIVNREGRSINDIFSTDGEDYFRRVEGEVLLAHAETGEVVATGGGIVLDKRNRALMKERGIVVYLKSSVPVLYERLKLKTDRPLLKVDDPQGTLSAILDVREDFYSEATMIIDTDGKTPEAVAKEIEKELRA